MEVWWKSGGSLVENLGIVAELLWNWCGTCTELCGTPLEVCGTFTELCATQTFVMEENQEKRAVKGRHGGVLYPQQKGKPAPPGVGRKRNLFKDCIQQVAERGTVVLDVTGQILNADGTLGDVVTVRAKFPSVEAVVRKMFRRAAKGDVAAARWVTETGYGKTVLLGEDGDNPLGGGFAVVLPDNKR